jgi:hypothetical protein
MASTFTITPDPKLHAVLKAAAEKNRRSIPQEACFRLDESFRRKPKLEEKEGRGK